MLLLHGDCNEMMKQIPDKSVDMIFCDLPYGCTNCAWDVPIDLGKFWSEVKRIITSPASPIIFTCTTRFGNTLINSNPRWFRYDLVWKKNNMTGFLSAAKMPLRGHEMIYVFAEKTPTYLRDDNHKKVRELKYKKRSDSHNIYRQPNANFSEGSTWDPLMLKSVWDDISGAKYTDQKGEITIQGTQKPIALLERLIKYYCPRGGVVLDPTMGSGTTGIACLNLARDFIGIEMNDLNFERACDRLYDHEAESGK
jgi:site-specific DNA-methyltransferase (adenine-specific)